MKKTHFNEAVEMLNATWDYGPLEIECLWEAVQKIPLTQFVAGLKSRIKARSPDDSYKPPMSSVISWVKREYGGGKGLPQEYLDVMQRIENGEITTLYWKRREQDYPALLLGEHIYIQADAEPYPPRIVMPAALGRGVLVESVSFPKPAPKQKELLDFPEDEIPF